METQENLEIGIGDKEAVSLTPQKVKIVGIEIKTVGENKNQKVAFSCKHPDKEEPIQISSVKYEHKGKLETVGTWYNIDEDHKIRKGSALAVLMQSSGSSLLKEMADKEIDTVEDEKGYLAFKAY